MDESEAEEKYAQSASGAKNVRKRRIGESFVWKENQTPKEKDRYRVLEVIHDTGKRTVYHATDSKTGRDVVLKTTSPYSYSARPTREEQDAIIREAREQGKLEHPNIVTVFDLAVTPDNRIAQVQEYMNPDEYQTLDQIILAEDLSSPEDFDVDDVCHLFSGVASAIDYMASRGVIHRDLKPGNIFYSSRPELKNAKVNDFELSNIVRTKQGFAGTRAYASPERLLEEPDDVQSEVFTLGVLAFEVLTRERFVPEKWRVLPGGETSFIAHENHDRRVSIGTPQGPRFRPEFQDSAINIDNLNQTLRKAVAVEKTLRYQSATEFSDELIRALGKDPADYR